MSLPCSYAFSYLAFLRFLAGAPTNDACKKRMTPKPESGHWIEAVLSDGEVIKLEDGSLWEVDAGDQVTAALWLAMTDVVVCDAKIINTEDNETVEARRVK